MEITAIEPRRKFFSQLYIDGEPAVKIDTEVLALSGLKVGSAITDEELHELIQKSDAGRAKEKALYLLGHRSHSRKELEDKIAREAVSREAAKTAAEQMEELGLVDDERFARDYAQTLFDRKKYGSGRVRQELLRKGIDKDTIETVLEEYSGTDTAGTIRSVLERKYPGFSEDEKIKRRAYAALQRMGYRYEEIRKAMDEEWDE